ncbi:MAG TPA: TetR/AcrR family transcriptional regulator [Solirubrobacterales bacterium]|nr:TetR/AcrR family transcriptional regulator [Solirubrobacterales bacterium]
MSEPGGGAVRQPSPALDDRIRHAVIELVIERGYEGTSIAMICDRAGLDRAEFDRRFKDKEDCVLQVLDEGIRRFAAVVFPAYEAREEWRKGLRAAAYAAARWVRDNPRYIYFGTLMMNGATELARTHRDMALQMFAPIVDDGRAELDDPDSISPATAMTVIGSIYQSLIKEVASRGTTETAESFVPQLMCIAVRPYLGDEAALEELRIPPPPEPGEGGG